MCRWIRGGETIEEINQEKRGGGLYVRLRGRAFVGVGLL